MECEKNGCISAIIIQNYQKASEIAQELVDGNGRDDAESWYIRGLIQIKMHEIPEACESFKNASNQENSSKYIQESYWELLQLYQKILEKTHLGNYKIEKNENLFSDLFNKFNTPKISLLEIEL